MSEAKQVTTIDEKDASRLEGAAGGSISAPDGTGGTNSEAVRPSRRRLPDERLAITHHFSIAGHEGYLTVGLYEDGSPGEIFITIAKQGSTISGLMDLFATVLSLALQHGVPL
jgi:ribonucleoside-diphosphate reductase alpha chain